jgi:hypothetical protein
MRITITPTASNTPTPSVTASQTPSYTPTGTVCPGLTPTATNTPSITPSVSSTPPSTPTNTPSQTASVGFTPTVTATPTATPTTQIYFYLGRTAVDAGNSGDACSSYLTVRPYYCTVTPLSSINVGDRFYDSYPSTPTNGGNNWIALRLSGVGTAYSFQIDSNGYVIQAGGNC